jgi:hypothetical protein
MNPALEVFQERVTVLEGGMVVTGSSPRLHYTAAVSHRFYPYAAIRHLARRNNPRHYRIRA